MEDLNRDVLGVSVSPLGVAHLKRLVTSTRWTFILAIALSLVLVIEGLYGMLLLDAEKFRDHLLFYLEVKMHIYFTVIFAILSLWQWQLYRRFCIRAAAAFQAADSDAFNQTFVLLLKSNRIALAGILIAIAYGLLRVVVNLQLYLRLQHRI